MVAWLIIIIIIIIIIIHTTLLTATIATIASLVFGELVIILNATIACFSWTWVVGPRFILVRAIVNVTTAILIEHVKNG